MTHGPTEHVQGAWGLLLLCSTGAKIFRRSLEKEGWIRQASSFSDRGGMESGGWIHLERDAGGAEDDTDDKKPSFFNVGDDCVGEIEAWSGEKA